MTKVNTCVVPGNETTSRRVVVRVIVVKVLVIVLSITVTRLALTRIQTNVILWTRSVTGVNCQYPFRISPINFAFGPKYAVIKPRR